MSGISFSQIIHEHAPPLSPVVPVDLNSSTVCRLDFTAHNPIFREADLQRTAQFETLVNQMLQEQHATVGIGGYFENRVIYRRSAHFASPEAQRSVHMGVDIWMPAFTPVMAPLAGRVHSFQHNNHFGDYGPTVILEHYLGGHTFYTLYGHLTLSSLAPLHVGQEIKTGEAFTQIGPYPENGDWPPHLHFQVITDMLGQAGDFPGVCTPHQSARFAKICPNPNLLLKCKYLEEDFTA